VGERGAFCLSTGTSEERGAHELPVLLRFEHARLRALGVSIALDISVASSEAARAASGRIRADPEVGEIKDQRDGDSAYECCVGYRVKEERGSSRRSPRLRGRGDADGALGWHGRLRDTMVGGVRSGNVASGWMQGLVVMVWYDTKGHRTARKPTATRTPHAILLSLSLPLAALSFSPSRSLAPGRSSLSLACPFP
jgi:hypothetical protein